MKKIQRNHLLLPELLFAFIPFLFFLPILTHAADARHYSEETLISLYVEDKELRQVLKEISWVTGYSFVINREYAELKISTSLNNVTLHNGLKEIIGTRSHTITYEPDKTVLVAIYQSSPQAPQIQSITATSSGLDYTISPDSRDFIAENNTREDLLRSQYPNNRQIDLDHGYRSEEVNYDEENRDYVDQDMNYDEENRNYIDQDMNYDEENRDYVDQNMNYDEENRDYVDQNMNYDEENRDYVDQDMNYDEEDNRDYVDQIFNNEQETFASDMNYSNSENDQFDEPEPYGDDVYYNEY